MQDEISRMPADDEERAEKGILSLLLASDSQRPWSIADAAEGPSEIGRLAGGEISHRRWAARLACDAGDVASLSILATDQSPFVRAEAAYGLARAATDDVGDPRGHIDMRRVIAVAQVIADVGKHGRLSRFGADPYLSGVGPARAGRWWGL
jgi:hypothetical protein